MSRGTKIKTIEEFPRRLKIFLNLIIALLFLGTISFRLVSEKDFKSSIFRTFQTLAFMFNENGTFLERSLEIFLALVGVFLIWWVLWSISDMFLEGNLNKYLKTRRFIKKMKNMENHIIIIGGGRIGEEISRVISLKNKAFVIVEISPEVSSMLKNKNYLVVEGDGLNEDVLNEAEISKASKLIITLPKTESNILITLTAKELNPNVEIHSRSENPSLTKKLKRAGAKVVVVPELVAADKMANDLGL